MDIQTINKPLNSFLREVRKKVCVDRVIVYGSYPNGSATTGSDIDVAVVSDDFGKISRSNRLRILDQAARFIRPEIVAVGLTEDELEKAPEGTIIGQIKTTGMQWSPA